MNGTGAGVAPAKAPETGGKRNVLLLAGGYFSLAFAVFQISAIFWPPNVIRYFGGPAEMSVTKPVSYALLCIVVGLVVAVFGFYALSGAGQIRRLPLLRTVVTTAAVIYLLRGLLLLLQIPMVVKHPGLMRFAVFSAISLCVGFAHLGGLLGLYKHGRPAETTSTS